MMQKTIFKMKGNQKTTAPELRYSTHYEPVRKRSVEIKNKLTKGCQNYESLRDAYVKQNEGHVKTDHNECTFEPNKLSSKKKKLRSFNKFLQDQENYQQNRDLKVKQFKTQITKAEGSVCSNRPSIDKMSRRICTQMSYDQEEVFYRLSKRRVFEEVRDDEDLFSPKILVRSKQLKRSQKISDLLHSDALRRQQKKEFNSCKKMESPDQCPMINRNTDNLVCRKVQNQFNDLVPQDLVEIPIVMAWSVISQIFNIEMNPNKSDKQAKMCIQMMNYLCKDDEESVQRQTLWEFIEIIIRKKSAKTHNFTQIIDEIINTFGNLYSCRLSKRRTECSPQPLSFAPQTLKISDKYANKYRQKLLESAKVFVQTENTNMKLNQEVQIQDMFMIDFAMKKASIEKKKLNKEKQEMRECTFKPKKTEQYKKPSQLIPHHFAYSSKNLKSSSSLSMSVMNQTMNTSVKALEKQQKKVSSHGNKVKQTIEVKNLEQTLMRMKIARSDRQLSNQLKKRGYSKGIQNWNEYTKNKKNQVLSDHKKLKGLAYKKISLR